MSEKENFLKWFEKFTSKYTGYKPKDPADWYDRVIHKHKKIEKILPKNGLNVIIDLPQQENGAPPNDVYPIINEIVAILPNYFYDYPTMNKQSFLIPTLKFDREISGTKHIMTYAKRKKTPEDKLKKLGVHISKLGEIWAKTKSKKLQKHITLTFNPKAFCLIGLFGMDSGSCFSQASFNSDKKYAFADYESSFMVISHKDANFDSELEEGNKGIDGRMMAVLTGDKYDILNSTNGKGYLQRPNIQFYIESMYRGLFDTDKVVSTPNMISYSGGLGYFDPPAWSCYTKKIEKPHVVAFPVQAR
jgi:hypothetical protein